MRTAQIGPDLRLQAMQWKHFQDDPKKSKGTEPFKLEGMKLVEIQAKAVV